MGSIKETAEYGSSPKIDFGVILLRNDGKSKNEEIGDGVQYAYEYDERRRRRVEAHNGCIKTRVAAKPLYGTNIPCYDITASFVCSCDERNEFHINSVTGGRILLVRCILIVLGTLQKQNFIKSTLFEDNASVNHSIKFTGLKNSTCEPRPFIIHKNNEWGRWSTSWHPSDH